MCYNDGMKKEKAAPQERPRPRPRSSKSNSECRMTDTFSDATRASRSRSLLDLCVCVESNQRMSCLLHVGITLLSSDMVLARRVLH